MDTDDCILPEDVIFERFNAEVINIKGTDKYFMATNPKTGIPQDLEHLRDLYSTHRRCETCGTPTQKLYMGRLHCEECLHKQKVAKRDAAPFWGGEFPICITDTDVYLFSWDDIVSFCIDNDCLPENLFLSSCEPQLAACCTIDEDHFYDVAAQDDDELPDVLQEAIKEFNKKLESYTHPLSWAEGKPIRLTDKQLDSLKSDIEG